MIYKNVSKYSTAHTLATNLRFLGHPPRKDCYRRVSRLKQIYFLAQGGEAFHDFFFYISI